MTASDDKTVKIWDSDSHKLKQTFEGHDDPVTCTDIDPLNYFIVSGSKDSSIRIWDIAHKQQILGFLDNTGPVNSVVFHPFYPYVASAGEDMKIRLYDIRNKKLIHSLEANSGSINSLSFHPSGSFLLSASDDSKLRVWDLRYLKLGRTLVGHEGACTVARFSPKGDYFASGDEDGNVLVWEAGFGGPQREELVDYNTIRQPRVIERAEHELKEKPEVSTLEKERKKLIVSREISRESTMISERTQTKTSLGNIPESKILSDDNKGSSIFRMSEKEEPQFEEEKQGTLGNLNDEQEVSQCNRMLLMQYIYRSQWSIRALRNCRQRERPWTLRSIHYRSNNKFFYSKAILNILR